MDLDTGATAWMLMSASLVLLMTPGLAFFYGGMVRGKSVLNMMMMSFIAIGAVVVVYVLYGWSMSYGADVGGLFGNPFDQFGLSGTIWNDDGSFAIDAFGVPVIVGVAFQVTFAIITVALISGAIADRVKFSTWVVFAVLWVTVSYFPLAHMVWGGGLLSGLNENGVAALMFGWDAENAVANVAPIDFAGGTVVHINAGIAGLVLALLIGKRKGFGREPMRPHNLPFVMLGAALLWFGWFGFNAGSAFTADGNAGLAWVNTTAATAAAMIGWLITEKIRDGHATSLGAASGVVAGLVAITPAAGALRPVTSIVLGVVAGVLCALAVGLKYKFGYDDSLDVVGVHLVGGLVGTIGIGFLAAEGGLFFGDGVKLLVVQIVVALLALVFSGLVTLVIGYILKVTLGWRVSEEAEVGGIDLAVHGETAYETLGGARVVTEVK
ncbi:ammonium transporter [Cellulomonas denverensis]|uniref:Ammonium transporter n=1 Tax=Cellulomonas denverensis TaxID=264297 RepID=A0A7X6QZ44_9CELL|nr:ammonium transporter [Cellulomonas denverensis]NKY22795.1 ammonium transporter [Cellulomonas denverensis]GIG25264.1 ammonium transporter [Cellulomonas denverensis]